MRRLLTIFIACLVICATAPPTASAAFGLADLDVFFENEDGSATLSAGSHPFAMRTSLAIATKETAGGKIAPEGEVRNLTIGQIPGLVGSQTAVPTCSSADFATREESRPACSDETAVGYAAAEVEWEAIEPAAAGERFHSPVYNLDPPPGVAAQLGFIVLDVPVTINVKVSESSPYNLIAEIENVPQALFFYGSEVVLWGNPADAVHDPWRGKCLGDPVGPTPKPASFGECPVDLPEEAFLTLPRSCGSPLSTVFTATSWLGETAVDAVETRSETEPRGIQGCEDLVFTPTIVSKPTSSAAASASGLDFDLEMDQKELVDPRGRAQSDIRKVVATLPEGMTLNSGAANGLGACSPAQYSAESLEADPDAGCPDSAHVGTVTVETPLLEDSVNGHLYVAEQKNNPFGSLFALYMVIRDEKNGILIKQAGKVELDPNTGQLRSTFEDIPQLPFARFSLHFRGGPGAPLATPSRCGTHGVSATLTPRSGGAPITETSTFEIAHGPGGGSCLTGALPFSPGFTGGSLQSQAGAYSSFSMRITRADGEQEITGFGSTLPPGVVGKIAGVEKCSDAAIEQARTRSGRAEKASPSCPLGSKIGTVVGGAGMGGLLTYVGGTLYLAGPYRGHPLSVVSVVPAVAGPFDLGTVVVRSALDLDPDTAQVRVVEADSDPIPRILQGVPLQLRDLRIEIDRPQFTLNATSCEPAELRATLSGTSAFASLADRYQATGCEHLRYKPKLNLKLLGATKRGKFPAVRSTLTPRAGDANSARAVVTLPPSQQIENAHINNPCTRVQFAAEACPKKSILGRAKAWSPLLDEPLQGNVYFRSNGGERELPDLVADLRGQFRIILVGFIDTRGRRIRTTFANIPDAPVSRFQLNLAGGKRGLLVNNRNICKAKQRAKLALTAQNGRKHVTRPVIKTSCKKGKKPGKGRGGKGGGGRR